MKNYICTLILLIMLGCSDAAAQDQAEITHCVEAAKFTQMVKQQQVNGIPELQVVNGILGIIRAREGRDVNSDTAIATTELVRVLYGMQGSPKDVYAHILATCLLGN